MLRMMYIHSRARARNYHLGHGGVKSHSRAITLCVLISANLINDTTALFNYMPSPTAVAIFDAIPCRVMASIRTRRSLERETKCARRETRVPRTPDDVPFFLLLISSSAGAQETHRLRFRSVQGGGDLAATNKTTALLGRVNGLLQRGRGRGR